MGVNSDARQDASCVKRSGVAGGGAYTVRLCSSVSKRRRGAHRSQQIWTWRTIRSERWLLVLQTSLFSGGATCSAGDEMHFQCNERVRTSCPTHPVHSTFSVSAHSTCLVGVRPCFQGTTNEHAQTLDIHAGTDKRARPYVCVACFSACVHRTLDEPQATFTSQRALQKTGHKVKRYSHGHCWRQKS